MDALTNNWTLYDSALVKCIRESAALLMEQRYEKSVSSTCTCQMQDQLDIPTHGKKVLFITKPDFLYQTIWALHEQKCLYPH